MQRYFIPYVLENLGESSCTFVNLSFEYIILLGGGCLVL